MNIVDKRYDEVKLKSIPNGTFFEYEGMVFIKLDENLKSEPSFCAVYDTYSNTMEGLCSNVFVLPLEVEIQIKGRK